MKADGYRTRRRGDRRNPQRRASVTRLRRWPHVRAVMSMPRFRERALARIERPLIAEDPGLGLRFALFTKLTRHEAIPGTEQVPGSLHLFIRRIIVLPLLAMSLAALLTASWLAPGQPTCTAGANAPAPAASSASRGASCQPEIRPGAIPVR